ncbi:hypothetical protein F384_12890 [Citrobacter amalonaticus Y19]|uniref:Sulfatase-modifying factor enzyme-like domain-containing protein n=1 Tax=Citrobacter amalonaticus Y19 TaxID=1261127 RepID=A0A0F6TVG5_CITAM|nr:SUMF1/EgtB/PvdO family nonheme iron enzyme [Citrobacter amalonaticus]AKE59391.1 hypothetical protein F384_12890 [Citrobacter amalonaticus Y19]
MLILRLVGVHIADNHRAFPFQRTGNPLGLHDMLGNISEMMFTPFYLNKINRLHGQAGGFVVRGGSVISNESEIRSATRKEINYYDEAHPFTSKTTGLRLVLVSPTITSTGRVKQLEKNWASRVAQEDAEGDRIIDLINK